MVKRANRVQETAITTGTGTLTLAGAVSKYRAFSASFAVGDSIYYSIEDVATTDWEVGAGTLLSATTLSRDQVFSSSNAGALVAFTAGTRNVWCTDPAENQWPVVKNSTAVVEVCTVPVGSQMIVVNTFDNRGTLEVLEHLEILDAEVVVAIIPPDNSGGFKNKIIGGDFTTNPWQRGTSFPALANATYSADRWYYQKSGTTVQTISKIADTPTAMQAGIYSAFCLGAAVTTAQTTLAVGDYNLISQRVEGFNAASLGFGQSTARNVTLSFWVKGAKVGVHCVSFRNNGATRSYVAEYSIIAINTWEYKAITIPVDAAGTWLYDTGLGLEVMFTLAVGTTFQTTANSWQTGNFVGTANQVNELDVVGNTFKLDLVQLEIGSVATPFETRDVGRELALSQRYYYQNITPSDTLNYPSYAASVTMSWIVSFPVRMRATPTLTSDFTGATLSNTGPVAWAAGTIVGGRLSTTSTAISTNANIVFQASNFIAASAEL